MKVNELANSLGKHPREIMGLLSELGVRLKNPQQRLDQTIIDKVKSLVAGNIDASDASVEARVIPFLGNRMVLKELATLLDVDLSRLMRAVLERGMLLNLNSEVEPSLAIELASKLNVILETDAPKPETDTIRRALDRIEEAELDRDPGALVERPPVITIMGHVDHGKTRLLDSIRKANVMLGEAGGITQHIGAYQVGVNGRKITFLDTPGHAAFTSLRARGAQITDITVLVVAADEGIKPQTIEAIHHAKAANVPIIVALNKMDKPEADPDRVKQQLVDHDLLPEEWGGRTIYVPVSAKNGDGIPDLLDMILLQADMMELRADPSGMPQGVVIESRLSRKKGPIATVLVKSGTIRVGDSFVIDATAGRVRALLNDCGDKVNEATPGAPVEVLGLVDVPTPGAILEGCASEKDAKELATSRSTDSQGHYRPVTLESLSDGVEQGAGQRLNLIIKADVNGSMEAIIASIGQVGSTDVTLSVIHAATGPVNENDIMLARASNAIIIGFGVSINAEAQNMADNESVEVKMYSIIYQIVDDLTKAVQGLLKPEFEEIETGRAEVRQLFRFSKLGVIAGSYVTSGKIIRSAMAKVLRGNKEVFKGKFHSLKRFQDDAKEVATGFECGIVVDGFESLQEGDVIVSMVSQEKKR